MTTPDDPDLYEIGHYVVTCQPSGSVLSAVKCSFFGSGSIDVAIAKSNRLEIRQYQPQHINDDNTISTDKNTEPLFPLLLNLPINGRITSLCPIRFPSAKSRDCLFFTTERGEFALISFDETLANLLYLSPENQQESEHFSHSLGHRYPIQTHSSGSFSNYTTSVIAGGCIAECGPLVAVDPLMRCIALHVYDGWITVIPVNRGYDVPFSSATTTRTTSGSKGLSLGPFGDLFHARIEERTLLSMTFLLLKKIKTNIKSSSTHSTKCYYIPQLVLLHQDVRGFQHIVTHGVDLSKKGLIVHGTNDTATSANSAHSDSKPPAVSMPPLNEQLKITRIDGGSAALIAVPPSRKSSLGGLIILGQRQVTFHQTGEGITKTLPIGSCLLYSYCEVEENSTSHDGGEDNDHVVLKYLVGDETGRIHLLTVLRNIMPDGKGDGCVTNLLMETLGTVSSASALVYLGKGFVFVGSQFGDSQLVKILDAPVPVSNGHDRVGKSENDPFQETTYLRILEEYTNLGPIVDFDLRACSDSMTSLGKSTFSRDDAMNKFIKNRYRQSLIVTCSGVGKDGSVRVVRSGVGMREHAEVEMSGIKAMWSLRRSFTDEDDTYLVQSFVSETRILGVQRDVDVEMDDSNNSEQDEGGAALAEVTIPGFDSSKSTLFAGNLIVGKFDLLLQVVQDGLFLVNSESLELVSKWSPFNASDDESNEEEPMGFITVASANESGQIVVALHGGTLLYLLVEGEVSPTIRLVQRTTLNREISCIDLHPFEVINHENSMDIEKKNVEPYRSPLVAVGLWDDFSVRLLYIGDDPRAILNQVLHINLAHSNDIGYKKSDTDRDNIEDQLGDNSQHMMARSLCLVTLKSQSSNRNLLIDKKVASLSQSNKVDMLLVGLGDGKLISFTISHPESSSDVWSVHSRKEVCLGTQGINLIPFQSNTNRNSRSYGTCVLATGDRPTIVYLSGGNSCFNSHPKLCYSTISLMVDDYNEDGHASHRNISVNVAASFRSTLLFPSTNVESNSTYSLCIADENTLRLGVIEDIQKLHITSCKIGMTPRRITYHEAGRVYCVGCIDGSVEEGSNKNQIGAEVNMGNCIRFFDDSTFEEINRIDLEPFETILSLTSVSLCVDSVRTLQQQDAVGNCQPYILIGTAYAYPDEDEPTQGRVLVVECNCVTSCLKSDVEDMQETGSRHVRHVTQMPTKGGVYSITAFYLGTVLLTVNSKTHLCRLSVIDEKNSELEFVGAGHHGHMLSLFVSSLARTCDSLSLTHGGRSIKQLAIVGDLMRSISLVEYQPKHNIIEELARDYNANFCTAIEMLTNNIYLGSEGFNNLFVLRHNANACFEEARVRLDTIGEYHLGEMPNKFMGGSLIMPCNQEVESVASAPSLVPENKNSSGNKASSDRHPKIHVRYGSQTLYGTVDGTIGSILGLDGATFAFLSTLQRAMVAVVKSIGDLSHEEYRAFRAERQVRPSRGFIDGDLIETFLDLNRLTMEKVVKHMNDDGRWRIRDRGLGFSDQSENDRSFMYAGVEDEVTFPGSTCILSVEDVLSAVEELSMAH